MGKPYQGQDVDIFAFGILMLFMRVIKREYPIDQPSKDDANYMLLCENPDDFWDMHKGFNISDEFKSMI